MVDVSKREFVSVSKAIGSRCLVVGMKREMIAMVEDVLRGMVIW
jgi:hypothetical protein